MCPARANTHIDRADVRPVDGVLDQVKQPAKDELVRGCHELFKLEDPQAIASTIAAVAAADPELAVRLAIEGDIPLELVGRAFGSSLFLARQGNEFKHLIQQHRRIREILEILPKGRRFLFNINHTDTLQEAPSEITALVERYVASEIRHRSFATLERELLPEAMLDTVQRALERKEKTAIGIYSVKDKEFKLPLEVDPEIVAGVILRELAKKMDLSLTVSRYLSDLERNIPNILTGRFHSEETLLRALLSTRPLNPNAYPISKTNALHTFISHLGSETDYSTLRSVLTQPVQHCTFIEDICCVDPMLVLREVEEIVANYPCNDRGEILSRTLTELATELDAQRSLLLQKTKGGAPYEVTLPLESSIAPSTRFEHDYFSATVAYSLGEQGESGWITLPTLTSVLGLARGEQALVQEKYYVLLEGPSNTRILRTPRGELIFAEPLVISEEVSKAKFWFNHSDGGLAFITAEMPDLFEYSLWGKDAEGKFRPIWRYAVNESSSPTIVIVTLQNGSTHRYRVRDGTISPSGMMAPQGPIEIGKQVFLALPDTINLIGKRSVGSLSMVTDEGLLYYRANDEYSESGPPPKDTWIADLFTGTRIDLNGIGFIQQLSRFGEGFICAAGIPEENDYKSFILRLNADGSIVWKQPGSGIVYSDAELDLVIFTNNEQRWTFKEGNFTSSHDTDDNHLSTIAARTRGGRIIIGPTVRGLIREIPSPPHKVYFSSYSETKIHLFRFDGTFTHFCSVDSSADFHSLSFSAQTILGSDVVTCFDSETETVSLLSQFSRHDIQGALGCFEGCFVTTKSDSERGYRILERHSIEAAALTLIEKDISFLKTSAEALRNAAPRDAASLSSSKPTLPQAASSVHVRILNKIMADSPELLAPLLRVRSAKNILIPLLHAYFPELMMTKLGHHRGKSEHMSRLGLVDSTSIAPSGGDPREEGISIGSVDAPCSAFFLAQEFAEIDTNSLNASPIPFLGGYRKQRAGSADNPTLSVTLHEPAPEATFSLIAPLYATISDVSGSTSGPKRNEYGGYSVKTYPSFLFDESKYRPRPIKYSLELASAVLPYDVSQSKYDTYVARLTMRNYTHLLQFPCNLPKVAEDYVKSIKVFPPLTRVALISHWIQRSMHYDFNHAEVRLRYAGSHFPHQFQLMASRVFELRREHLRRGESCDHLDGKEFAGVCAQAAILGVFMLRHSGIAASYGIGYMVENGEIRTDRMHALPIVYFPTKHGGTAKMEVECTPPGRDPATGRVAITLPAESILQKMREQAEAASIAESVISPLLSRKEPCNSLTTLTAPKIPAPSDELRKVVQVLEGIPRPNTEELEEWVTVFKEYYWPNSNSRTLDREAAVSSAYFEHQVGRLSEILGIRREFASDLMLRAVTIASEAIG